MNEPVEQEKTFKLHLVYLGTRRDSNRKKVSAYHKIHLGANDGSRLAHDPDKVCIYKKFRPIGAQPGAIFEVDATEKAVFPSSAKTLDLWKNEEDVTYWATLHRAVEAELLAEGKVAREIKASLPTEVLAPFRRAYKSSNAQQQAFILALVIREVTRHSSTD